MSQACNDGPWRGANQGCWGLKPVIGGLTPQTPDGEAGTATRLRPTASATPTPSGTATGRCGSRTRACVTVPTPSRPRLRLRLRPLGRLAVELDVDALVEEAQQAGDPPHLSQRLGVVPDEVLAAVDRVVGGGALVRAPGHGVRRLQRRDDVLTRDVPPR